MIVPPKNPVSHYGSACGGLDYAQPMKQELIEAILQAHVTLLAVNVRSDTY